VDVLNWVAVGLLGAALVPAALAWAGLVRFRGAGRLAGRAFAILDIGALLQAVAQLPGGVVARWVISSAGLVLVVLGAVLILRLRSVPVRTE
jgi:hypothetical protein